jgi:hypothetical protein
MEVETVALYPDAAAALANRRRIGRRGGRVIDFGIRSALAGTMIFVISALGIGTPARAEPGLVPVPPPPMRESSRWEPPPLRLLALQERESHMFLGQEGTTGTQPTRGGERSLIRSILFGALAGAGGFYVGGLLGSKLSDECDDAYDLCLEEGTVLGAAGGGTLGLAVGVHMGNGRQGSLGKDLLVASGIWAVGVALALGLSDASEETSVGILVAIPILQLGATVAVERAAGRRRSAEQK